MNDTLRFSNFFPVRHCNSRDLSVVAPLPRVVELSVLGPRSDGGVDDAVVPLVVPAPSSAARASCAGH